MTEQAPQYLIGIDLGTTNTVVAYADMDKPLSPDNCTIFEIEQLVLDNFNKKVDISILSVWIDKFVREKRTSPSLGPQNIPRSRFRCKYHFVT